MRSSRGYDKERESLLSRREKKKKLRKRSSAPEAVETRSMFGLPKQQVDGKSET
jgi:hypothetical protein